MGSPSFFHLRRPFLVTLLLCPGLASLGLEFQDISLLNTCSHLICANTDGKPCTNSRWVRLGISWPHCTKAKLRTPAGPRAKGCAVYCPQPRCLIPDLPTAERSPPPRTSTLQSGTPRPPPPLESSLPPQLPGAVVLSATPGGLEAWASTRPLGDSDACEDRQRRLHQRQAPRLRPGSAPNCSR